MYRSLSSTHTGWKCIGYSAPKMTYKEKNQPLPQPQTVLPQASNLTAPCCSRKPCCPCFRKDRKQNKTKTKTEARIMPETYSLLISRLVHSTYSFKFVLGEESSSSSTTWISISACFVGYWLLLINILKNWKIFKNYVVYVYIGM